MDQSTRNYISYREYLFKMDLSMKIERYFSSYEKNLFYLYCFDSFLEYCLLIVAGMMPAIALLDSVILRKHLPLDDS